MTHIIKTYGLTKIYDHKEVVSQVNMNVKKGEIYGFIGPNGAGKTTVMKMLINLIKPTSGEIEIFDKRLTNTSYELLKRMGTIIEYPIFYDKLTANENLQLHCEYMGYYDKKAINQALELVNLKNIENKQVKDFSLGMKQRLGIARAITTKPELLILDEPINGLDPLGIKEMRDLFKVLCKEYEMTILVSSHILGELEQIVDTVGIIRNGRLIKEVSMSSIHSMHSEYIEVVVDNVKNASFLLEHELKLTNFKIIDKRKIHIFEPHITQQELSRVLIVNEVAIDGISKKTTSLEDYFFELMNGGEAR
ncbi:ABC transporter ATP-binding protein [Bacillus aquiflavi]|uniref:ABC transporter ATP-binding protein n=1 Tax=Bacillus aquiflavi TaxID=2672567 RepID=A0A6B3VYR2_9BACI|nr:ABC transporter ATP-binding protein [Bacillus aquiflavi]MBA4536348.1 ABC transporter ATP-binding protein [Bacillus aquiflavi]NEY80716.1 ABC transporter ATP-binding protein [Bacillus aquiflavi]UAC48044.1 ABC transporter ATP-binding protein [Bacillus aquiflavi]